MTKRVYFFPHAGATGSSYAAYKKSLATKGIESILIDYKGHGRRISEQFSSSINAEATFFVEAHKHDIGSGSYAFFGHSFGSAIVFEACKIIRDRGIPLPDMIYISSGIPPYLYKHRTVWSKANKKDFDKHLTDMQLTPQCIIDNKELYDFFIPIIKNDYSLLESYSGRAYRLSQKAKVLYGEQETIPEIHEWDSVYSVVEHTTYPGDHFYLFSDSNILQVTQMIETDLHVIRTR